MSRLRVAARSGYDGLTISKMPAPDPGYTFADPAEVLSHPGLTTSEKAQILRSWFYDASDMAVAEEEGMLGTDDDLSRRILLALEQLADGPIAESTSPTKQHGIP